MYTVLLTFGKRITKVVKENEDDGVMANTAKFLKFVLDLSLQKEKALC